MLLAMIWMICNRKKKRTRNDDVLQNGENDVAPSTEVCQVNNEGPSAPTYPNPLSSLMYSHTQRCSCHNCQSLTSRFSECTICMEPLQCRGPCACLTCGSLSCLQCFSKLVTCGCCRAPLARTPNKPSIGLTKIINKLMLPCRNNIRGCEDYLTAKTRGAHEGICKYNAMYCPIGDNCNMFLLDELITHIKTKHNIYTHHGSKLKLTISNVRANIEQSCTGAVKYIVVLVYDTSAFLVVITVLDGNMIIEVIVGNLIDSPRTEQGLEIVKKYNVTTEVQNSDEIKTIPLHVNGENDRQKILISGFNNCVGDDDDTLEIVVDIKFLQIVYLPAHGT